MKQRPFSRLVATIALALFVAGPAPGQTSAGGTDMESLVDEVRRMVEKGERERLADPWFLKDLRALVDRYDNPWRGAILRDDFSARGPAPAQPWQVMAGEFLIDWRHGLRAVVGGRQAAPAPEQPRDERKDAAAAILGAIVQQALSGKSTSQDSTSGSATPPQDSGGFAAGNSQPAAVAARLSIPNAFSLKVQFSARPVAGVTQPRLEIGPYQGASTETGYRLIHQGGASPSFTLLSVAGRRVATVDLVDRAIDLQDNAPHTLEWTRDRSGRMRISLDGAALMEVTDRRFRDPFDGLVVVNAAGDFALREVEILGAR